MMPQVFEWILVELIFWRCFFAGGRERIEQFIYSFLILILLFASCEEVILVKGQNLISEIYTKKVN